MAILRAIRNVALFPFFLIVALSALLGVAILVAINWPHGALLHHRWKSNLRRQGRYRNKKLNLSELTGGTLIVDAPALGWNVLYCWWTPDDLPTLTPFTIPSTAERKNHVHGTPDKLQMDFDEWCYENYLSVDTGSAILLATRRGDHFSQKLIQDAPNIGCVETWSGPCFAEDNVRRAENAG